MELSHFNDHNMDNKMTKQEMHFPVDVMINILYRLPSISIVRFQAVSKYWCYAICFSDVLNARFESSLMSVQLSTNVVSGKLAHFNFNANGKIKKSVHSINVDDTLDYNFSNMVNGMACAYGNNATTTFYLINLTTFETSKYSKRKITGISIICDKISLGFDPSTGLYKFIRIYSHTKNCSYYCEILEIDASFKGSWKIIGELPFTVDQISNSVFLNGAIHWLMVPQSLNKEKPLGFDIVKLDMKEEKFEMVAQTFDQYDKQVCNWEYDFTLSEEKGKLYVLHWCCQRQVLVGWRLKESERDKGVWNIVFHVDFASMGDKVPWRFIGKEEHAYVVGIVDGKVLIRSKGYDKGVYIYSLAHKKLSSLWVDCGSFYLRYGLRRMLFYRRE